MENKNSWRQQSFTSNHKRKHFEMTYGIMPVIQVKSTKNGPKKYFLLVNKGLSGKDSNDFFYDCPSGKQQEEDEQNIRKSAIRECKEKLSHLFELNDLQLLNPSFSMKNDRVQYGRTSFLVVFKCENINYVEDLSTLREQFQQNYSKFLAETDKRKHLQSTDYEQAQGQESEKDNEYYCFSKFTKKYDVNFLDFEEIGFQLQVLYEKRENCQFLSKFLFGEEMERIGYRTKIQIFELYKLKIITYKGLSEDFVQKNLVELKFNSNFKYTNEYLEKNNENLQLYTYSISFCQKLQQQQQK